MFLLGNFPGFAQEKNDAWENRILVKTNIFNLLAQRSTFSVEKVFKQGYGAEISFVQGKFNYFLFTDHYYYRGFLLRTKKYFGKGKLGVIYPYLGVYAGNLKRTIQTNGQSDHTGWFGFPSRDFSAQSVRGGGTLGIACFFKSKIVVDGQTSLGYGRYLSHKQTNPNTYAKGYLDMQVWLSLGYGF
ncbi:hypothetical protein AHMF7605_03700 [Adhaeribacter arboris]|uniref:DUF3575 domain-containing protein n=2 Tax=Adhaeribacter arboris TaxID=2072846 RepID=A0A2T2YAY0_9BACT|nr:hypothetical protein AHMF7605_03700 [Adhaeribacter arboris]